MIGRACAARIGLMLLVLLGMPSGALAAERVHEFVGVVDIPALFRPAKGSRPAIGLRSHPRPDGHAIATVHSAEELDVAGLGYGTLTAVVYERLGRWSLLRLKSGRLGWLAPEDAGKFASLERVLHNNAGETYLTGNGLALVSGLWDRRLAPAPGSDASVLVPRDPEHHVVGHLSPRITAARRSYVATSSEEQSKKAFEIEASYPSARIRSGSGSPGGQWTLYVLVGARVPAYAEPDATTAPVQELRTESLNDVRKHEDDLVALFDSPDGRLRGPLTERFRVPVFDRRPGWFQIRLGEGSAWFDDKPVWVQESDEVWTFEDAVDQEEEARRLHTIWFEDMPAVRLKDSKRVDGRLWFHVEVWRGPACPHTPNQRVMGEGWLPAHDARGRPHNLVRDPLRLTVRHGSDG